MKNKRMEVSTKHGRYPEIEKSNLRSSFSSPGEGRETPNCRGDRKRERRIVAERTRAANKKLRSNNNIFSTIIPASTNQLIDIWSGWKDCVD